MIGEESPVPVRSTARAHLSQLIEMFGTDGCLRIHTASAPDGGGSDQIAVSDSSRAADHGPL
ncbi:hypothetical protein [Streptomyces sp. PsTaAH-124]|uniref:hypothetical protein n=1 Tax=Streptomyces sp. PsTaAH-124 TaxID=1157638 RepID=UPI0003660789|nr:hypothetical protein [Streptomyces sp. PsTaAH-124]EYT82722.1 hypothetical protein CF54_11755 [Streptomyces sp. Tu 6176]